MLKAAIAQSLRESPVVVSDVEDGEIFDDDNANDDDKNNNDTGKSGSASPNASALTNLGWGCVTTASAAKTAGKSTTRSQREKSDPNTSVTLTGSDAECLDRRARHRSEVKMFLGWGIKRTEAKQKQFTSIFGRVHGGNSLESEIRGPGARPATSHRSGPSGSSQGRKFLERGVNDNTRGGGRSRSSSPSVRGSTGGGGGVAPLVQGGGHSSPLMALDGASGHGSSRGPGAGRGGGGPGRSSPVPGDPDLSRPGTVALMRCPLTDTGDPEPEYLGTMKHIVFVDLDNWCGFFSRLPGPIPDKTFVWGFHGGNLDWKEPNR